jgi:biotin carboxyl carrier protein
MKYSLDFGGKILAAEKIENKIELDGLSTEFKILSRSSDSIVLILENKIYKVDLISSNEDGKTQKVSINGKVAEYGLKSDLDLILEKLGGSASNLKSAQKIKAPMPGLIVKVLVSIGESVEKGQNLLNFEAMKMENQIKAPGPGIIKNILVKPGDKIEKGQVLIEID